MGGFRRFIGGGGAKSPDFRSTWNGEKYAPQPGGWMDVSTDVALL